MQTKHLLLQVMVDFHACRWPPHIPSSHDTSIAEYFDNLNEPALSNLAENLEMEEEETGHRPPLLTFSHFLPLQVHTSCARSVHVAVQAEPESTLVLLKVSFEQHYLDQQNAWLVTCCRDICADTT